VLDVDVPNASDSQPLSGASLDQRAPWLLCIFCLLLTLIPADVTSKAFAANLGTPARLVAGLFCFLLIVGFLAAQPRPLSAIRVNPGVVILGAYFSLMSIVWGKGLLLLGTQSQELSKQTAISKVIIGVGVGLYTIARVDTARKRSIVTGCLLAGITYSAVVGVLQHTARIDIAEMLTPPGFESPLLSSQGETVRRGSVRAFGTFLNALPFGAICASAVPLAIHFARYSSKRSARVGAGVAALILLSAVPTSIARSSLIVLAVAMLFYAISLTLRRITQILIGLAGVYMLIALTSFATLQSLWDTIANSADDPSVLIRINQNEAMLNVFHQHPVFGIGVGSVTVADFGPIDNFLALSLAEGGITWIVAFAALSLGGVCGIAASLRRSVTGKDRDQTYALGAMFLGLLVACPTFATLSYEPYYSLFFLLFGMLWSGCSYSTQLRRKTSVRAFA
jgi:hypothetical protein